MVWLKKSRALGKQDKKNLFKKSWDTLLTATKKYGIMNTVKRGRELKNNAKTQKEKNLKNPLDKPLKVWYNEYVIKGESFPLK